MIKINVIDETHYMGVNETIRLEHGDIVANSFVSSVPVVVNYKDGTITTYYPAYYEADEDGKFEVVISYVYYGIEKENG